jgi:hypothetical protein
VRERLLSDDDSESGHYEPVPWCVRQCHPCRACTVSATCSDAPVACSHRVPRAVPRLHAGSDEHRLWASLARWDGSLRKIPKFPPILRPRLAMADSAPDGLTGVG